MIKKIGILLSSPKEVGGIYQYSISLVDALNKLNKKKFKIYYYYTDKCWEQVIPDVTEKIYIKKKIIKKIIKKIFYFFYFSDDRYTKFSNFFFEEVNVLNKSECDLIIFPSQDIISYQIKKKSISTIHDLMHIYEPHFEEYTDAVIKNRNVHYSLMCNAVDGIFVDSILGKKHVLDNFKIHKNKLLVLPFVAPAYLKNFVKFDIFKKFNIPEKYFFYPAQFWEHKNHINLIKAISIINTKNSNEKINLVLCGAKKNYFNHVFKFIKKNKLCKNTFYIGRVEDKYMASLYRCAYATIYPSFLGPTNIPPLEAISLRCPVICSNKYAMKKQLGKSALYFNPKSPKEIANQIQTLIKTKNMRQKLIYQGKMRHNKYNEKHFRKKLENFLLKLA
jgi:glycosyltransferase involved in cell wall biosynthesis